MGKEVTFNDILSSNYQTGIAFIENNSVELSQTDVDFIMKENGFEYQNFIQDTFRDIYYFDLENRWLDMVVFNINNLSTIYKGEELRNKQALAYHALFQACLSKRPFNLFHRKNLYFRNANIDRSFSNKKIWDTDFSTLFNKYAQEASSKVFCNGMKNKATCNDIMKLKNRNYDLIYLDSPYTRPKDKKPKDYYSLYHFLEGLVDYKNWIYRIDWSKKNRSLIKKQTEWEKNTLVRNFETIFREFEKSIIVISYCNPRNPSTKELKDLLLQFKSKVSIFKKEYSYSLNRNNGKDMYEVLIIGT